MNKRVSFMAMTFLTAGLLSAAAPARAQTDAPPPGGAPDSSADAQQPDSASQSSAQGAPQYSVLAVSSVEVLHSDHKPAIDIIRVQGVTSADGWSDPQLLPLT